MPTYGKGFIKSPLGVLKIIEIILCIVIICLTSNFTHHYYVYDELFPSVMGAAVAGLVISLLILILSCACGDDVDPVLQWQCIVHLLLTVWFLVTGIMLALRDYGTKSLIIAIIAIVTGVVYLLDTIFSYKDYKPF